LEKAGRVSDVVEFRAGGNAVLHQGEDSLFVELSENLVLFVGGAIDESIAEKILAARIDIGEAGEEASRVVRVVPFA